MLSHSTFYISRKAIHKNHNIWWSFYDANEEKNFAAMHHIDKYLVMRIHEVILPISPPLAAAAPTALPPHALPQYAIVPIPRSCPAAWCNKLGLITAFAGMCRVGQVATAGSPTRGVWLNGAMVSSVM